MGGERGPSGEARTPRVLSEGADKAKIRPTERDEGNAASGLGSLRGGTCLCQDPVVPDWAGWVPVDTMSTNWTQILFQSVARLVAPTSDEKSNEDH